MKTQSPKSAAIKETIDAQNQSGAIKSKHKKPRDIDLATNSVSKMSGGQLDEEENQEGNEEADNEFLQNYKAQNGLLDDEQLQEQ